MKIIIAVHHFPPHRTAGAEQEAWRTARTLMARGHHVEVICVESIDAPINGTPLTWRDEIYQGLPVRRLSFNLAAAPNPDQWEYDNRWVGDHLHAYLTARQPDIFHLFSGYLLTGRTLLVAKTLGIPTVVSLMDFWFLCRRITLLRTDGTLSTLPINPAACARCLAEEASLPRFLGQVAPALMDAYWHVRHDKMAEVTRRLAFCCQALNSASQIISRSHFLGKIYTQAGIDSRKIVFCRQGFEQLPTTAAAAPAPRPADGAIRLLYLGQINQHKGVHTLVEAIRNLPHANVQLTIYGDVQLFPSYVRRLLQMANADKRIRFGGLLSPEQVSGILQSSDVLVVPSLWYENSPNTIAEAFAHRVPVIASNLGGMAELVHHNQNGLLFTAGASDDLARQLQRLFDEPNLLAQLRAGIKEVKSLTEEIDELETIYRALHIPLGRQNMSSSAKHNGMIPMPSTL